MAVAAGMVRKAAAAAALIPAAPFRLCLELPTPLRSVAAERRVTPVERRVSAMLLSPWAAPAAMATMETTAVRQLAARVKSNSPVEMAAMPILLLALAVAAAAARALRVPATEMMATTDQPATRPERPAVAPAEQATLRAATVAGAPTLIRMTVQVPMLYLEPFLAAVVAAPVRMGLAIPGMALTVR